MVPDEIVSGEGVDHLGGQSRALGRQQVDGAQFTGREPPQQHRLRPVVGQGGGPRPRVGPGGLVAGAPAVRGEVEPAVAADRLPDDRAAQRQQSGRGSAPVAVAGLDRGGSDLGGRQPRRGLEQGRAQTRPVDVLAPDRPPVGPVQVRITAVPAKVSW